MDGTLLDTENVFRETFRNMLKKEYDKKYDDETHKAIVGMKTLDRCKYLVRKLDLPVTAEQLYQRVQGMRKEIFSNTNLKPGAEKLVTHLHASNVPIAIATGTSKATYDIKTKYHPKLFRLFHHVVNASSDPEVPVGKPDPRIYLVCLSRFEKKPRPEECLVFEDSYNGLLAATRSRTQVVFVPELDYPEVEMKYAVMMIKSLEDFKPEEFSLPPYPKAP